ncbi:meiosis expressed gene 1 protein homolog isoform 2-T2 [Spheniscus humboldti]
MNSAHPIKKYLTLVTSNGCLQLQNAAEPGKRMFGVLNCARREPLKKPEVSGVMAKADIKPKSIHHAKKWSDDVENLYRFQQAGYRDEIEYKQVKQVDMVECWPETGFVKKLQRRDNTFYYYDKQRECEDKEVHKVKVYVY